MKKHILKTLSFLRIVDAYDGNLSLTNIIVYVAIYKIFTAQMFSLTEVSALVVAMISYGYKKHVNKQRQDLTDENAKAIDEIKAKVQQVADKTSGIAATMGLRTPLGK